MWQFPKIPFREGYVKITNCALQSQICKLIYETRILLWCVCVWAGEGGCYVKKPKHFQKQKDGEAQKNRNKNTFKEGPIIIYSSFFFCDPSYRVFLAKSLQSYFLKSTSFFFVSLIRFLWWDFFFVSPRGCFFPVVKNFAPTFINLFKKKKNYDYMSLSS